MQQQQGFYSTQSPVQVPPSKPSMDDMLGNMGVLKNNFTSPPMNTPFNVYQQQQNPMYPVQQQQQAFPMGGFTPQQQVPPAQQGFSPMQRPQQQQQVPATSSTNPFGAYPQATNNMTTFGFNNTAPFQQQQFQQQAFPATFAPQQQPIQQFQAKKPDDDFGDFQEAVVQEVPKPVTPMRQQQPVAMMPTTPVQPAAAKPPVQTNDSFDFDFAPVVPTTPIIQQQQVVQPKPSPIVSKPISDDFQDAAFEPQVPKQQPIVAPTTPIVQQQPQQVVQPKPTTPMATPVAQQAKKPFSVDDLFSFESKPTTVSSPLVQTASKPIAQPAIVPKSDDDFGDFQDAQFDAAPQQVKPQIPIAQQHQAPAFKSMATVPAVQLVTPSPQPAHDDMFSFDEVAPPVKPVAVETKTVAPSADDDMFSFDEVAPATKPAPKQQTTVVPQPIVQQVLPQSSTPTSQLPVQVVQNPQPTKQDEDFGDFSDATFEEPPKAEKPVVTPPVVVEQPKPAPVEPAKPKPNARSLIMGLFDDIPAKKKEEDWDDFQEATEQPPVSQPPVVTPTIVSPIAAQQPALQTKDDMFSFDEVPAVKPVAVPVESKPVPVAESKLLVQPKTDDDMFSFDEVSTVPAPSVASQPTTLPPVSQALTNDDMFSFDHVPTVPKPATVAPVVADDGDFGDFSDAKFEEPEQKNEQVKSVAAVPIVEPAKEMPKPATPIATVQQASERKTSKASILNLFGNTPTIVPKPVAVVEQDNDWGDFPEPIEEPTHVATPSTVETPKQVQPAQQPVESDEISFDNMNIVPKAAPVIEGDAIVKALVQQERFLDVLDYTAKKSRPSYNRSRLDVPTFVDLLSIMQAYLPEQIVSSYAEKHKERKFYMLREMEEAAKWKDATLTDALELFEKHVPTVRLLFQILKELESILSFCEHLKTEQDETVLSHIFRSDKFETSVRAVIHLEVAAQSSISHLRKQKPTGVFNGILLVLNQLRMPLQPHVARLNLSWVNVPMSTATEDVCSLCGKSVTPDSKVTVNSRIFDALSYNLWTKRISPTIN